MIRQKLNQHLALLKQNGLYRRRKLSDAFLNFSSSDYLSLTYEASIRQAYQEGFSKYPSGSSGSMVVSGYHPVHRELEQNFAKALEVDEALLFSSGYAANLGIISLFAQLDCHFVIDKASHASFYDGLKLTNATYSRYLHNDMDHLAERLAFSSGNSVVIAESVFSMSGQSTDLGQLRAICQRYGTETVVDEAHAFGVFGDQGLGAVKQFGLNQNEIPLRVIPLGKAFGFQGAIVAGQGEWIDALLQSARSHIYSTAVSPALAYGILKNLDFIRTADDRRQKLQQLIHYFQKLRVNSPLIWRSSTTPIQQLQLGCPHKASAFSKALSEKGIFCQAMREPTVTKKESGLRVLLNYSHEPEDIDNLFHQLHRIAAEQNLLLDEITSD